MFHPNRRYGDPATFRAYTAGVPIKTIAHQLRRCPRTISDWMTGKKRIPWWVPELLQLRHEAALRSLREMGIRPGPRAASCPPAGTAGRPAALRPVKGQHDAETPQRPATAASLQIKA